MNNVPESDLLYAKREKIQNRWVKGFFQNIRVVTIWITLGWFFMAPWLTYQSRQAILFDVNKRLFYIFGMTFWPQDFFLLLLLLLIAALALIIITNLAGRLWCGYTCPQTVWTRFFMWIEYLTEGDRNKRMRRDQNPWELSTIFRRFLKHFFWLLLALFTAITFVGYFSPIKSVYFNLIHFSLGWWETFWIAFFTLATYVNAGWMREQVCLHICPYARFQSVMLDEDSMVISYDASRGEPRGPRKHHVVAKEQGLGDCIDCELCVQVCPTGIDIRQGLQMACIGCAACIDACNGVMNKMDYPKNLIRYASENAILKKKTKILRLRLLASILVFSIISCVFLYLLITRIPLRMSVAHDHRNLYRVTANNQIENSYVITVTNMTEKLQQYQLGLHGLENMHYVGPQQITLKAEETAHFPVTITTSTDNQSAFNKSLTFQVQAVNNEKLTQSADSKFFYMQER